MWGLLQRGNPRQGKTGGVGWCSKSPPWCGRRAPPALPIPSPPRHKPKRRRVGVRRGRMNTESGLSPLTGCSAGGHRGTPPAEGWASTAAADVGDTPEGACGPDGRMAGSEGSGPAHPSGCRRRRRRRRSVGAPVATIRAAPTPSAWDEPKSAPSAPPRGGRHPTQPRRPREAAQQYVTSAAAPHPTGGFPPDEERRPPLLRMWVAPKREGGGQTGAWWALGQRAGLPVWPAAAAVAAVGASSPLGRSSF